MRTHLKCRLNHLAASLGQCSTNQSEENLLVLRVKKIPWFSEQGERHDSQLLRSFQEWRVMEMLLHQNRDSKM